MSEILKVDNVKKYYLNYAYMSPSKRLTYNRIEMSKNTNFSDSLYPFIEGGVHEKMQEFMESSAPILILLGDPGTGKTSFIREFITSHMKSDPYIVYDEETAADEGLYTNFLESNTELMIFEDADNLMSDRINDNNKNMNKILNLANGLLDIGRKKFIFTANITDVHKIDQALIRPGRCFDVINFRPLTPSELRTAASELGMEFNFEGSHTISELFNNKQKVAPQKMKRIGF